MTVQENLEMGAYTQPAAGASTPDLETVFALFPRLKERPQADGRHPLRR